MNCLKCCTDRKWDCCPLSRSDDSDDDDLSMCEDPISSAPSLEYGPQSNPHLTRPKSIPQASVHNMDGLMDMALAQTRVTIFVPISPHIEFARYADYLNATTIIHPFSTFRLIWDSFIMVILVFTCFEIPFTLCFGIETNNLHSSYGQFIL
eukprot:280843_1